MSWLVQKKNEIKGVEGRGQREKGRRKGMGRRAIEIKRNGEGEPASLHASNLLMVEEKQTIIHYLSQTWMLLQHYGFAYCYCQRSLHHNNVPRT